MPPTKSCLLIIDMINELTFDGAERLFPSIEEAAEAIARLKSRMKNAQLPVVYVNDNFGKWQSDFRKLVARCLDERCRGRRIVQVLAPEEDDYFVLKPKHSGFYATPLELLLNYLDVRRLVLTGITGDSCVLYTAADAYMRGYEIVVLSDCIVSMNKEAKRVAIEQMHDTLKAVISDSDNWEGRLA
jgi:nicotinamidase-related amidase